MGMEFVTWYMICGTCYTVHGRSTAILEKILVTDCENRECAVTSLVLVLTGMMKAYMEIMVEPGNLAPSQNPMVAAIFQENSRIMSNLHTYICLQPCVLLHLSAAT